MLFNLYILVAFDDMTLLSTISASDEIFLKLIFILARK